MAADTLAPYIASASAAIVQAKGQGQSLKVKVTEVKTNFAPIWAFPDRNSSLNLQMAMKWCTKLEGA